MGLFQHPRSSWRAFWSGGWPIRVCGNKRATHLDTSVTLWNNKGQVSRVTNEYNQPTIYAWDDAGRLKESKFTLNLQQMNTTYDAYDRVLTETDANGNTTTYEYDNAGRRTKMTGPSVSGTPAIVTYTWDTPGNMLSLTDSAPAVNAADAVGNTTTWRYDKRNRMQFEDIVLTSATPPVLSSRENRYYLNDTVQWTKDRDLNWIEYKYNFVMGDYQLGQERWWKWSVNYINDINYQYNDPKGLLLTDVYERAPGTTQVNNHIEFDYDGLARATKVKTYLTGNGAVAAQGGVVAVAASAVSTTFDVDHTWDSSDRRDLTAFYFNDQTTTLKKQEFRSDYTWDKLHRLDLVTQQVSSAATQWVVDAARTKSADFDYYPNSQLKKLTRLQGSNTTALITDYKQNSPDDWWVPGRISKVEHSGLASGTQITSNDFDVAGRIIQKVTPAQTYNYAYDTTDQLTTVTNAGGSTLQDPNFNAVGNDTGHTVSYYNRVLNDGTYTYVYNNEGSRTRRTKTDNTYETYTYDHRQRLTAVASFTAANVKTKEVKYEYDALDRRFRRRVDNNGDGDFIDTLGTPDVRERLLYDTNPMHPEFDEVVQIISETTAGVPDTDKRTHRFLNGPQPDMVLTDEVFNGTGTNDILWLLQDHQNTVTDVATLPTSGSAILRNHLEYNAFGQITSQTDATYAPVQTYTGQILDTATGLLYYDARWYDPQLGRFVAEDPSGFAAGDANLSRMVGNSFPNGTDPSGLDENEGFEATMPHPDYSSLPGAPNNFPAGIKPFPLTPRPPVDPTPFDVILIPAASLEAYGLTSGQATQLRSGKFLFLDAQQWKARMGFCGDDIAFAPHIVHLGKWKYDAVSVSDGSRTWYLLPQVVNTEVGPVTFGYYAFNSAQQLEDHLADVEILLLGRAAIFGAVAMADARLSARSMCLRPGYQRGFPRIKAPTSAPERLLALRQQYIDGVKGLSNKVSGMRKAGLSPEQIARSLQAQRRALGEQFKNVTDPKLLEQIYQRNLAKYGDKLGPSIDWLRARGKTWEQIIDSASRPGGGDLGF